jgi:recombination protein RecA
MEKIMSKDNKKKTPVSMMSVLASLRKSFGNDAVFAADDEIMEAVDVISTGSYALDKTIGILGIPRGRITQFAGAEASGKTLLALQIVKKWQEEHLDNWALWIDAEYSFNKAWAIELGVDVTRLIIKSENMGSTIFNMLCGIPNSKNPEKKDKTGFLDDIIALGEGNRCGLVVLDSIAAIEPPVEAAYEVGKQNMAAMARFMPQALRRLTPLVHESNVAFIAINQLRIDPGVQYGNPETTPGGRAWKHFCRLMINFAKVNAKEELILNANDEPVGHTVRAKIQKNSFAIPRDTKFVVKYLEGIVHHNVELVELAIKYNILQRPNNKTYVYGEQKWNGRGAVEQGFLDKALFNEIWEKIKVAKENTADAIDDSQEESEGE